MKMKKVLMILMHTQYTRELTEDLVFEHCFTFLLGD